MTSASLATRLSPRCIEPALSILVSLVCSYLFVQKSKPEVSTRTTTSDRTATAHDIRSIRDPETGEPGFYCAGCDDYLVRIRTWDDPGNRNWAAMMTHWLNEHDPTRQFGRP